MPALVIAWMQNPLLFSAKKVLISPFLKTVKCHKAGLPKTTQERPEY